MELSCLSPLWWWTHPTPPHTLLPCPLFLGLQWLSSNLGLLWPLLRVALRWSKLPRSMASHLPSVPSLLPQLSFHLLPLLHLIGRIGSLTGTGLAFLQAMWGPIMFSLRTSDTALPFHPLFLKSLLLVTTFQSLLLFTLVFPIYT